MHPVDANKARPDVAPATAAAVSSSPAAWSADMAALEARLRDALDQRPATSPVATSSAGDEVLMRRVRQMVQESEKRQESELALRMAEAVRELQVQRQADLVKIDRTLGLNQYRTGIEVMRNQRQMNNLAQQVSQRP